jgi:hypothetical protein
MLWLGLLCSGLSPLGDVSNKVHNFIKQLYQTMGSTNMSLELIITYFISTSCTARWLVSTLTFPIGEASGTLGDETWTSVAGNKFLLFLSMLTTSDIIFRMAECLG